MNAPKNVKQYDRMEFTGLFDDKAFDIVRPDGKIDTVKPFLYQPTRFEYDQHGYENLCEDGASEWRARYTPDVCGKYEVCGKSFQVMPSDDHGYIKVSDTDSRYFEYSDGTTYFPIGLNMAFPKMYKLSSGVEFGKSHKEATLGLRQYKRWFDSCKENGVNMVRLWIGHPYFTPDTEETYRLDYKKLTLLDTIVEMARERDIKLKLTLEQFRYCNYNDEEVCYPAFNKKLYHEGKPCPEPTEWLWSDIWQEAWYYKLDELAKRYNGDTTIFAIELWNEMNCFGEHCIPWSKTTLPKLKKIFDKHMVINSLGSLDCEETVGIYHNFCWDKSDFVQVHRYIDQGAPFEICNNPIEMIQDGVSQFMKYEKPVLVAETGAVDDCHSNHFRFYSSDDRGLIFADTVYTPVFYGSCGIGNIWHWDDRYLESKELYKMFRPVADLCRGVDFVHEEFCVRDYSDDNAYILELAGKTTQLLYIRNKSDNWQNVLRDLKEPEIVERIILPDNLKDAEIISIWDNETANLQNNILCNLKYGTFIKGKTRS